MSEPRVLIVFATTRGHTRRVARRVAEVLGEAGLGVVLADLERVPDRLPAENLCGVILAGPVHFGRHPRKLRRWVTRNRSALERLPSLFVSVSGAAIGADAEHRTQARGYADAFTERTGWTPDRICLVGGEIAYTRYNPILRRVMRAISRREGRSTDTSRDHVYTDWAAVERFARVFGAMALRRAGIEEAVHGGEGEPRTRTSPAAEWPRPSERERVRS